MSPVLGKYASYSKKWDHNPSWTSATSRFDDVGRIRYVYLRPIGESKKFMILQLDHVDVKEISKRKLKLGYTPDVLSDAGAWSSFQNS